MKIYKLAASSAILDNFLATTGTTLSIPNLRSALEMIQRADITGASALSVIVASPGNEPLFHIMASLKEMMDVSSVADPINKVLAPLKTTIDKLISDITTDPTFTTWKSWGTRLSLSHIDINKDMEKIVNMGGGASYGTRAEQYPVMIGLLSKFKTDILAAANSTHNAEVASVISANGLTDYSKLAPVVKNAKPMPHMFSLSKELIDDIMGIVVSKKMAGPALIDYAHKLVKEKFARLVPSGINATQQKQVELDRKKEEMERAKNPSSAAPGATPVTTPIEVAKPYNIDPSGLTNPFFLISMLIFFTEYIKAVQILP
jgi:hypothetical protein